jgi:hypothetical protein
LEQIRNNLPDKNKISSNISSQMKVFKEKITIKINEIEESLKE